MVLKRAARTLRRLPDCPAASVRWRTTTCPEPTVCRFTTTAPSVSSPAASLFLHHHRAWKLMLDDDDVMTCAWLWFKWRRLSRNQPHSLVLVRRVQWQDRVKTAGEGSGCRSCRKVVSIPSNRLRGSTPDFLSGFTPLAFGFSQPPTRQWDYLSHSWNPDRYYHSGSEWTWEQWQLKGSSTFPRTIVIPDQYPCHRMQFKVNTQDINSNY